MLNNQKVPLRIFRFFLLTWFLELINLEAATRLPAFTLESVEGTVFEVSEPFIKKNKALLINFFATWCIPCRAEMLEFQKLYDQYKENDFLVVSISIDQPQTQSRVPAFIKSQGFTFPVLLDKNQTVVQLLGVNSLPTNLLVNRHGEIVKRTETYQKGDELLWEEQIKNLLQDNQISSVAGDRASGAGLADPQGGLQLSGNNFIRINYGKENRNDISNAGWLEDWFDWRIAQGELSYKIRFRGYQFLRDLPDSRNNTVRDPIHRIVKQQFQYDSPNLFIQAGNLYTTVNRGFILRMWDDRLARIDKDINGLFLTLKSQKIPWIRNAQASVWGGKVYDQFVNLYQQEAEEEIRRNTFIQGTSLEIAPRSYFNMGSYYQESFRRSPATTASEWNTKIFGGHALLRAFQLESFLTYLESETEDKLNYPYDIKGRALYTSLSGNLLKLALNLEYKYYVNFDMDFVNPPNLLKYHTFRLLSRNLLFPQNQREEGIQAGLEYRFNEKILNNLNLSFLQSHPEKNPLYLVHHVKLPFFDLDNGIQVPLSGKINLLLDLNYNQQKKFIELNFENIKAYSLGMKLDQEVSARNHLEYYFEFQHQDLTIHEFVRPQPEFGILGSEGLPVDEITFQQAVFTATYSRTALWSLSLDYELTTDKREKDPDSFHNRLPYIQNGWLSAQLFYHGLKNSQIGLWAGQRKHRVICSGGSCRIEPAFEGIELIMNTHF